MTSIAAEAIGPAADAAVIGSGDSGVWAGMEELLLNVSVLLRVLWLTTLPVVLLFLFLWAAHGL